MKNFVRMPINKTAYALIVDGVDVGIVRRKAVGGGGRGKDVIRRSAYCVPGMACDSRDSAEAALIRRAIKFGYIKAAP